MKVRVLNVVLDLLILSVPPLWCQSDWPMYSHDYASTRYSPLKQINSRNVQTLVRAWTYHMNKAGQQSRNASAPSRGGGRRASEATPIVVKGVMYLPTPFSSVVALEPETGKELWSYKMNHGRPAGRGVAYWPGDSKTPASILFGTSDGRLLSINAENGKPTAGFGVDGAVDIKTDILNGIPTAQFDITSPVTIYKDLAITGGQVQEAPGVGASGDTRAWDVHTGKLVWQFHSVPHPGEEGNETWPGTAWKGRSGTNVWGLVSVDTERGLIFLPYGSPSSDFYGADRKGKDLFGNCLVALDADNGKLVWYYQTVHHDTWDYDLESAPVLFDVTQKGRKIPAVAVIGKSGVMFILDRRNGDPIFGVEERPAPASDVPGEASWPTQPFPTKPPPLGRHGFTPEEIATVTPEQKKFCTDLMASEGGMSYGGPFTHYGSRLTIVFPGTLGTANWPGMSYNPDLGYLFVNTVNIADVGKVVKNEDTADPAYERTSPWGMYARFWNNDKFWPCQQPPWGELWAINANTGDVAWKVPFGIVEELEAKGVHGTGTLNFGGSITTASGLLFIAATNDQRFRAFDAATGKVLWEIKLETGSYTVPMTYLGKDGKQYVALTDTGGSFYDTTAGDSVIAFALP
ncbi:MAG: pyrroloquinoline quinone-dependent dehydrogenase [Candidatus Sulfotelmatobacter sp.]